MNIFLSAEQKCALYALARSAFCCIGNFKEFPIQQKETPLAECLFPI